MLNIKEKIFEFIRLQNNNVLEVLDFQKKNDDNENSYEHYIVRCIVDVSNSYISHHNMSNTKEKICLVDILEFRKWLNKKKPVIWLNYDKHEKM